jgi:sarcosine oxidase subunit alpha
LVARFADDVFYFTTTSSGAATVYQGDVATQRRSGGSTAALINLTGSYAAMNLAGPAAARGAGAADLDGPVGRGLPYLACREGEVGGVPVRMMRVGFVGEWGYEIHLPAEYAPGCGRR